MMKSTRSFALALVAGASVAACAPPSANPTPESSTEVIRVPAGAGMGTATQMTSAAPNVVTVAKPLNNVWLAMAGVYDSLQIPLTTLDPTTHSIGNGDLQLRRRLGNTAIREYLNCGTTQGVANADSYDIRMSVMSKLAAAPGGGTVITTTVQGMGRPISTSGDYLRCSTTGSLEIRLGEIAKARAGG